MADTPITAAALAGEISYQQSKLERFSSGTFVADDQDYHAMEVSIPAGGGILYGATNLSDKDMVITLYGAFESGLDVATDAGVFPIEIVGTTVTAGASAYAVTTHRFPYFIIRSKFGATPNGSTVTIYAASMTA